MPHLVDYHNFSLLWHSVFRLLGPWQAHNAEFQLLINVIGILLIILVALGYKTKLVSVIMVFWLNILNFAMHNFWAERVKSIKHDFKKYDFFQTLTVIGGLLQLIIHGPGTVSIDESKKAH